MKDTIELAIDQVLKDYRVTKTKIDEAIDNLDTSLDNSDDAIEELVDEVLDD